MKHKELREFLLEYCPIADKPGVYHIEGACIHSIDCYACCVQDFVDFVEERVKPE